MTIVIKTTNLVYVTDNMFPQIFPLSLNSLLDCKLLKDTDLNRLFSLNWDNFEGRFAFPLNTVTVQKRLG